jgi:hypothetical protein
MTTIRRFLLAIAAVLALGSASQAARLATPFVSVNSGQFLDCFVSNLNTKPATVTVTLFDPNGGARTPNSDTCNGSPLAPGASCGVELPAGIGGRCVVVANTGKTRAGINVIGPSTFPLVTVVPATK